MVKIRLTRLGAHKRPFYRMVVADSRTSRDGSFIEVIGTYNPQKGPAETKLDTERAQFWLQRGAQPTETALKLLKRAGLKTA